MLILQDTANQHLWTSHAAISICIGKGASVDYHTLIISHSPEWVTFCSLLNIHQVFAYDSITPLISHFHSRAHMVDWVQTWEGWYTIRVNGDFSLFVCVSCTEDKVWTVVGHDHMRPIDIRGSTPRSPFVLLFSFTISPYHLRSLVTSSEHCQQEVRYRCRKSRLFDTWGWSCFITLVYLIVSVHCSAKMLSFLWSVWFMLPQEF